MNSPDDELDQAIAGYLAAEDAGTADPAALIAAHPHLAHPLGAFLAAHAGLAGRLRHAPPWVAGLVAPGSVFAGLEVLREAGSGGSAVVYHARQFNPPREVALKVLHPDPAGGPEAAARFRLEAEAAGRLAHPNVARLFASGTWQGRRYLVVEWLSGGTLAERLDGLAADPPAAARVVRDVARGVAAAHAAGVLHRDLKPANVLFDGTGVPKLTDFGCAAAVDRVGRLTRTGEAVGTVEYMAPEQASPRLGLTTTRTDVHGLGAVLYAALTGRAPFRADGLADVLTAVLERRPPAVRRANPGVSADLAAVCNKGIEKDPARRYRSAEELADDLDRYLRGEPVRARPVGPLPRLARAVRRRPTVSAMSAALAATVLAGGVGLTHLWQRAASERLKADRRLVMVSEALERFKDAAKSRSHAPDLRQREDRTTLVRIDEMLTQVHDDATGDLEKRHDAAYGILQVAGMLGQVYEVDLALATCEKGVALLRAVSAADPANPKYRSSLSEGCMQTVGHRYAAGRYGDNLETIGEAVGLAAELVREYPDRDHYRGTHATFQCTLSRELLSLGRPAEVAGPLGESVREAERLVEKYGDVDPYRHVYYVTALGTAAQAVVESGGGPDEYLAAHRRLTRHVEDYRARHPDSARVHFFHPCHYAAQTAAVHANSGRPDVADAVMARADVLSAAAAAESPDSQIALGARADFLVCRGFQLLARRPDRAADCMHEAAAVHARMSRNAAPASAHRLIALAGLSLNTVPDLREAPRAVALLEQAGASGRHPPDRMLLASAYCEASRHRDAVREFSAVEAALRTTHRREYSHRAYRLMALFQSGEAEAARAELRRLTELMRGDYTTGWHAWHVHARACKMVANTAHSE